MDDQSNQKKDTSGNPVEPAHIVRTFAQDLATAGGKGVPAMPKKIPPPVVAPIQPVPVVPERHEELIPKMPPLASEPAPLPAESAPVVAPIEVPPPSSFEREAVLARLHAIQAHTPGSITSSPIAPTTEDAVQVPEEGSLQVEASEISPAEAAPPISAERIHTYKSDFADHVSDTGSSPFAVLAAEQNAAETSMSVAAPKPMNWRAIAFGAVGVLLLLGGGIGVYLAYVKSQAPANAPIAVVAPSLIFVDERVQLSGTGSNLLQALAASAAKPLDAGAVRLTYVNEDVATVSGTTTEPAPGGVLISELNLSAPDILFRNTDPSSTVGIVHAGYETRAFFILRVTSYERTFAGMLSWESTMPRDLALLYPPYPVAVIPVPVATTTASTTSKTGTKTATTTAVTPAAPPPTPAAFRDEVLGNYNVRALKDSTGRTVIIYGYRDKATLIIARDEDAFTELASRLSATKTQ